MQYAPVLVLLKRQISKCAIHSSDYLMVLYKRRYSSDFSVLCQLVKYSAVLSMTMVGPFALNFQETKIVYFVQYTELLLL